MTNKLYAFLIFCSSIIYGESINAQCPAGRYLYSGLFSTVTMDSVTYSTANGTTLKMDIYQPVGDTLSARPCIILAHEGSFVSGNRENDATIVSLCANFAKRGYVTASIDYRLGSFINMLNADSATDIVVKAISDGKAAIRFMVQDAATSNLYKIDTNNIFIGGNSAGAVLNMNLGYLDSISECSPMVLAALNANGGFEGNSGNAGYTTKFKAIINLAGAVNDTNYISVGDKPSVNAQGSLDNVVPYECGSPFGFVPVTLCGLGRLEPAYVRNSIYHISHVFDADGHVPWDTSVTKFNLVDSMVTVFLYNLICTNIAAVNEVSLNTDLSLFPNPAKDELNITSSQTISEAIVYDETGREIYKLNNINHTNCRIATKQWLHGIYFIKIKFTNANNTPLVKKIIVGY